MGKFLIFLIFIVNLYSSNLENELEKCALESLKKSQGNEHICLKAIKLLEKKWSFSKKDEELSSLYNYTAYIYEAKEDWKSAALYFEKSIALNTSSSDLARINLGGLYYHGKGVVKNYTKSYELWKHVVRNGDGTGNATNNLDFLCSNHPWACK